MSSFTDEMPAYADESIRGNRYLMAVVVLDLKGGGGVCRSKLRSQAKGFKKRSLHFNQLLPAQRKEAMKMLADLDGVRSYVFEHRAQPGESDMDSRSIVLTAMINQLVDDGVSLLVLDQWRGGDKWDGQTIRRIPNRLRYEHQFYTDEPMLWIADGIAYNAGAKHPHDFPSWHHGTKRV